MYCRICGCGMYPEQHVPVKEDVDEMISAHPRLYGERDMVAYYCSNCQHRQIEYVIDDSFYDMYDYVQDGTHQYYGDLNDKTKYVTTIKKYVSNGSILDVGCGQGYFLKTVGQYFENCCGVEPSKISYKRRFQDKNITYINDYFTTSLQMPQYDVIVAFQVLEHITDVNEFIRAFHKYMKDDGIGVINVPNGSEIFQKPCFSLISVQHINYFSIYSLCKLLTCNNFEILEAENNADAFEITVYFRKKTKNKKIYNLVNDLKHSLNEELFQYNKIAIWGAGGKADSYANLLQKENKNNILHIFDNDEKKYKGYIAGINISIEKPNKGLLDNMQVILILASTYNVEIIRELNDVYHYKGKIIYIEDDKINIKMFKKEKNNDSIKSR